MPHPLLLRRPRRLRASLPLRKRQPKVEKRESSTPVRERIMEMHTTLTIRRDHGERVSTLPEPPRSRRRTSRHPLLVKRQSVETTLLPVSRFLIAPQPRLRRRETKRVLRRRSAALEPSKLTIVILKRKKLTLRLLLKSHLLLKKRSRRWKLQLSSHQSPQRSQRPSQRKSRRREILRSSRHC